MAPVAQSNILDDLHGQAFLPAKPAELAQARAFERILHAEFARLNELATRLSSGRAPLPDPDNGGELAQIRERLEEVRHLLRALRDRFGGAE